GSVTVSALVTPANLVATAASASQVNVDWGDVAGADHYDVWRSSNGGEYAIVGSPSVSAFTDSTVSANTTYLYRVQAVDGGDDPSAFSNLDAATTVMFTDDPLVTLTTKVKLAHITELRTAVNAIRAAATLGALAADGTIAAGALVRAQHVNALRTGLNEARSVIGLSALTYTDPALTAGATKIKSSHIHELRNGVR
ncbi:MAG TPA: fibronectin type III domain-containing protein, partial [Thermoanaerobaculia bacterium]|nr:fibronectin type III domain-containing protein [Thermoanaerobaculia bacterium]